MRHKGNMARTRRVVVLLILFVLLVLFIFYFRETVPLHPVISKLKPPEQSTVSVSQQSDPDDDLVVIYNRVS